MDQEQSKPALTSRSEIDALVIELAELARRAPGRLSAKVAALSIHDQAELALRLPARERMELLLHAPKPMRLVRSLPDSEFHLTVRELDASETLPLLALSSADQIRHLLDLECWRGDRFDAPRGGAWVAVLLEAGEPTVRRCLTALDDASLALLFQQWVRTARIELQEGSDREGTGVSAEDPQGFLSPDGNYRFSPIISEHNAAVQKFAQLFFIAQPKRYQEVLWSAAWELPAELEEQALHWRQSRLEEHGFPNWEEALSIYAGPSGATLHAQPLPPIDPDGLEAPRAPLRALHGQGLLSDALERLPGDQRERALHEIVSVGNHLLVADGADVGDPLAHHRALSVAGGYIAIGIESRCERDPERAGQAVDQLPLIELFREGYAPAAALALRVRRLTREGWAAVHPNALDLLDYPIRDRVVGLLERRPLYLVLPSADAPGALRPFRSLTEINETRVALEVAEDVGGLMIDELGLDVPRLLRSSGGPEASSPRFSCLLLTLLAWHAVRTELRGEPLPVDVASDFVREVASRRSAPEDAPERALTALVRHVDRTFGLGPPTAARIERFGRACLEQLASECATLDPGVPLDGRYISCLWLATED